MRAKDTPQITPSSGGRLMPKGTFSQDSAGVANYVRKVNFRRIQTDREARREGWQLFRPRTDLPQGIQAKPGGWFNIMELAGITRFYITQGQTPPVHQDSYVCSAVVKANGRNFCFLTCARKTSFYRVIFNLSTGAVSTTQAYGSGASGTQGIVSLGNGEYYIWVHLLSNSASIDPSIPTYMEIGPNADGVTVSYAGDETKGITAKNAQVEPGTTPTTYRANDGFVTGANFILYSEDFATYWEHYATVTYGTQDQLYLLAENVRPNSEQCVIAADRGSIYRYNPTTSRWLSIGTGFSAAGNRWQVSAIDGTIVFNDGVDLPTSYRVEEEVVTPLHELREVGIASVGHICEYNGFLLCGNIVEVQAAELAGVMNGSSPYGIVSSDLTNHIPYRVIWSEYGLPRNWAPSFSVTMAAASATITLPFPASVFVEGTTRVAVINGGPAGGVLGGDSANPDGILVTDVTGAALTLAVTTDVTLTYPRTVQVMRWSDQSSFVGYEDLQDDASHIVGLRTMNVYIMVYRKGGIFRGRYTGSRDRPFDFRNRYTGKNVPAWGSAIIDVKGEYHLYPAAGGVDGGRFYKFDGENQPVIHKACDDMRGPFFEGLTPQSDVFAVNNTATKEIWFCRPDWTLCYDYEFNTLSEMDAEVSAAGTVSRPNWDDSWFILSISGEPVVCTYGLVQNAELNIRTWLRNGVNPGGFMRWGLSAFGDPMNEKDLEEYVILLSSEQTEGVAIPVTLKLYGSYRATDTPELLLTEEIADPTLNAMIPMFYRAAYFQDELSIAVDEDNPPADADLQFTGRMMRLSGVKSTGVSRNDA